MHSRLYVVAVALIACTLGGCAQATRHSNVMVFGTNTSFGIRAGTSAATVPEIQVGYSRQEAVVLPLVANTGHSPGAGGSDLLQPCDLATTVDLHDASFAVHPCSLVAINGKALDSYSVLASFGAKFGAQSTDPSVSGGLAQYFATGMAAQMLALNGGAAVVAVGEAASKAAENKVDDKAVKSLFGDETAFGLGIAAAKSFPDFRSSLLAKLATAQNDAEVNTKIAAFEQRAGIHTALKATCSTKVACIEAVNRGDYDQTYAFNADAMTKALKDW